MRLLIVILATLVVGVILGGLLFSSSAPPPVPRAPVKIAAVSQKCPGERIHRELKKKGDEIPVDPGLACYFYAKVYRGELLLKGLNPQTGREDTERYGPTSGDMKILTRSVVALQDDTAFDYSLCSEGSLQREFNCTPR